MSECSDQLPTSLPDSSQSTESVRSGGCSKRATFIAAFGIGFVSLLLLPSAVEVEAAFRVCFGWLFFLRRSGEQMHASGANIVLFVAIVAATGVLGVLLFSLRSRESGNQTQGSFRRSAKMSCASVAVVMLCFLAGTAFVGLIRNVIWMATSEVRLVETGRSGARRSQSKNNLKQIGLSLMNYHDVHRQFPPSGTFDEFGHGQHGWITHMLPYFDQEELHSTIDLQSPWNSERNAPLMKTHLPALLNPGLTWETARVAGGFAATHYAANPKFLRVNSSLQSSDVKDGLSNVLVAGEIKDGIPAWGSPGNFRSTELKLDSPGAFGSPSTGVVQFVLGDGTVRAISENIDPEVLKALFDPSDGQTLGDF